MNVVDILACFYFFTERLVLQNDSLSNFYKTYRLFKIFGVLRMLKLLDKFNFFKILRKILKKNVKYYLNVVIILFFIISVYSLLGLQIFGLKFELKNKKSMIYNYNSITNAWIITFEMMTLDKWYDLLLHSYQYL